MNRRRILDFLVMSISIAGVTLCIVGRTRGQLFNYPLHASGIWRSDLQGQGEWTASLAVQGIQLNGTIEPQGFEGIAAGTIDGTLSGTSITMRMTAAGQPAADFAGALTASGIKGTYQTTSGDHGEWEGSWQADAPVLTSNSWPEGTIIIPAGSVPVNTFDRRSSVLRAEATGSFPSSYGPLWHWLKVRSAYAQATGNSRVSKDVDGGFRQNEPEIAVDPFWSGQNRLIAGAIDRSFVGFQGIPRLGAYYSTDAGTTWATNPTMLPIPSTYAAAADPVLDFDCLNRVYYAGLAFDDPLEGQDGCSAECCDIAIVVSRGDPTFDGGVGWENAVVVESFGPNSFRTLDKPWLAVDQNLNSPYLNNVYVTYTRSVTSGEDRCRIASVVMKRSTDRGGSYGPLVLVSDYSPNLDDDNTWSQVAVDLNGDVNVMWVDRYQQIQFDKCTNGGTSCRADRAVAQIHPPSHPLPGTTFTMSWIPSMAIDTRGSSPNGYIYVVWNDGRSGNSDIYFTRSVDGGTNFAPARAIASMAQDEFFPAIGVSSNHIIYVIYYRRTGIADTFNTYMIFSTDAGQNWSTTPTQVNNGGNISDADQGDIGDYIGIDAGYGSNPRINAVWMDSRRNQQDVYSVNAAGC